MLERYQPMIFEPSVNVKGSFTTIRYVPRGRIQSDIKKVFSTTRINKYMFSDSTWSSLTFQNFFALEFYYILDKIINDGRHNLYSPIRQLKFIQKLLKANTWLNKIDQPFKSRLDYSKVDKIHFKLFDYQENFLRKYDETVNCYNLFGMLLAAAPGTGKTLTGLTIAECLNADKVIIICPKPAVDRVWNKSISYHYTEGGVYKVPEKAWTKESNKEYNNERFAIFHYESLQTAMEMVNRLKTKNTFIILDESHNLNEMNSLRTQSFIDLCKKLESNNILLMTGTPVKALSVEIIPMLKVIDPLFNDETMAIFRNLYKGNVNETTEILRRRYNIYRHDVEKQIIKLDEPIQETIKLKLDNGNDYTLETISKEILEYSKKRIIEINEQLPEVTDFYNNCVNEHRYKALHPNQPSNVIKNNKIELDKYTAGIEDIKKAYKANNLYSVNDKMKYCKQYEANNIIPYLEKEDKEKFKEAAILIKYPKLKIRGECLGIIYGYKRTQSFIDISKIVPYDDIIESTEKKTVIFTNYVFVVDEIIKTLKTYGYNPIAVYGKHTKDLSNIVKLFEKQSTLNPLIATYKSLSTAVPLVMADTMILIDPPYRQYILDQTIARIHRIGADSQTRIFHIALDTGEAPNISTRALDIINWSKEQVTAILGLNYDDDLFGDGKEIASEEMNMIECEMNYTLEEMGTEKNKKNIILEW